MLTLRASRTWRHQRGLSIVELMVGVAVGLFVVAAASMLVATQLSDNRRLTLETQVQQDLRASADIITRELRRAGHWGKARDGVAQPANTNPYRAITIADGSAFVDGVPSAGGVLLTYARSGDETIEDNLIEPAERLGFRRAVVDGRGVIQTQLGENNWQALTDSNTLDITAFTLTLNLQPTIPLVDCANPCPGGGNACWPRLVVRDITVDITGQAAHDSSVSRSLSSNVRLRNDTIIGACPP